MTLTSDTRHFWRRRRRGGRDDDRLRGRAGVFRVRLTRPRRGNVVDVLEARPYPLRAGWIFLHDVQADQSTEIDRMKLMLDAMAPGN